MTTTNENTLPNGIEPSSDHTVASPETRTDTEPDSEPTSEASPGVAVSAPGYKVGYKKPPISGQIQPGEVRNPNGRRGKKKKEWPTTTDKMRRAFIDIAETKIEFQENGKRKKKPAIEVLYKQLMKKALNGDHRSAKLITDRYQDYVTQEEDLLLRLWEAYRNLDDARGGG